MRIPNATYRLQFHRDFSFAQAEQVLDYLKELGITDVYASPLFRAGPDSTHGYDICCFDEMNSGLGNFLDFANQMRARGLGLVLDMVPNHMACGLSNGWWVDVLRHGQKSKYANYFDIEWDSPDPGLKGKVLLPILEDHYYQVLKAGKLTLTFNHEEPTISYYDSHFPLAPETVKNASESELHELLQKQHYRLAWWRAGSAQINYRRFFDVTGLVSLRMERDEVFNTTHQLLLSLISEDRITALRIDHPDGLWNPKQYFERLRKLGIWVVAEKILTGDEPLPNDWPVAGTTGYDYLNSVNGLFINSASEAALTEVYEQFTGNDTDFDHVAYTAKKRILELSFQSEVTSLTHRLRALAAVTPLGQDLTVPMLRAAIEEMIAVFPVYRTYVTESSKRLRDADRAYVEEAASKARSRNYRLDLLAVEFLKSQLLQPGEFAMKFQQLTGPVMAKGLEDTAFYQFNRFISLNEVGGRPDQFGISIEDFHRRNQRQLTEWPHTLLATSTHDTKRGEDVRARLNVLSEIPQLWESAVWRWSRFNEDKKLLLEHGLAPHASDEYLLYQTLVGAWPPDAEMPGGLKRFRERVAEFMLKAVREAKTRTSWIDPNPDYEKAVSTFVERILNPGLSKAFLNDLKKLQHLVTHFGVFNSLSQTLLKMTSPGVPDFYQGAELWDLSLVDPDNRRPVDFGLRQKSFANIKRVTHPAKLLEDTGSGQVKQFIIWKTLQFRGRHPALFQRGAYLTPGVSGTKAAHLCAFTRRLDKVEAVVLAPRLVCGLCRGRLIAPLGEKVWDNTTMRLPSGEYRNEFTGQVHACRNHLAVAEVLGEFPVALLTRRYG